MLKKLHKHKNTFNWNSLICFCDPQSYITRKATRLVACQSKPCHQVRLRRQSFSTSVCLPRPGWQLQEGVEFIHLWGILLNSEHIIGVWKYYVMTQWNVRHFLFGPVVVVNWTLVFFIHCWPASLLACLPRLALAPVGLRLRNSRHTQVMHLFLTEAVKANSFYHQAFAFFF